VQPEGVRVRPLPALLVATRTRLRIRLLVGTWVGGGGRATVSFGGSDSLR
jgi:hypothetical protein